ncbi:hypothetical protein GUJ93_ZPchr0007g5026 [Zizania palustris]|uniref:Uncharacterized protein n=1 Tax=Zizania palustris TaxID=103762 RepID=A0A8J5T6S0_ZIZPA|nr:hypothetical protein GUJ93_ZPchr0007g5026 [Zizania palustris]
MLKLREGSGGLEFLECNKDLRALRILGALHAKDAKRQSDGNGTLPVAAQQTGDALNIYCRPAMPMASTVFRCMTHLVSRL